MPESYFICLTLTADSIDDLWNQCLSEVAIN